MIFEKSKDDVIRILRMVRKSNDYASFDAIECMMVVIPLYQSIDVDSGNSEVTVVVNSNTFYKVAYRHGTAKGKLDILIKSEIRDGKINEVLSAK